MSERVDESSGAGSSSFPALLEAQDLNTLTLASPDIKEEERWTLALKARDCKWLMELLHQYPRLLLKTGPEDRTVLHVAVMQGCLELVKQVLGTDVDYSNRHEFQNNLKKILYAKDGKCRTDAFHLAAIVGNEEVIQVLDSARKGEPVHARDAVGGSLQSITSDPNVDSSEPQTSDASHQIDIKSSYFSSLSGDEGEIIELFKELRRSKLYVALEKQMRGDVDYNFDEQRKGLIFNFACKRAHSNIDFLRSVAAKAKEKPGLLQKLFNQMDAQRRTPLHVATDFCRGVELRGIQELLDLIPRECEFLVNRRDGGGRTALLRAIANGMSLEASKVVKILADDQRTDLNAEWPGGSGATALHLAVLHNHGASAKYLLEAPRNDPTQRADVEKLMTRRIKVFKLHWYVTWTPLELAAVMGRYTVLVNILLASGMNRKSICDQFCLHLAAAAGEPRSIQALLMNRFDKLQHFETNQHFGGYSCLHFAVYASLPHQSHVDKPPNVQAIDETFDRFLAFSDFATVYWLEQELILAAIKGPQKVGMPVVGYGGMKTCTRLLLQAGVEICPSRYYLKDAASFTAKDFLEYDLEDSTQGGEDFHRDTTNITHNPAMPDPGVEASDDERIWWYELVAKETLEAKNSFNQAGNATAVLATLVATASFKGPLTPPLGYGSDPSNIWTLDRIQMTVPAIRVFMASTGLSFYLAVASLMLLIMPSLPMPQEGLRDELRRSRRTVALATSVLLLAILALLVSYTSCVVAVIPDNHYWGYKFYPAFLGGTVCIVVVFLFFLRSLRLLFSRNPRIKTLYQLFGKL